VPVSGKSGSIADLIHPLPNTSFFALEQSFGGQLSHQVRDTGGWRSGWRRRLKGWCGEYDAVEDDVDVDVGSPVRSSRV